MQPKKTTPQRQLFGAHLSELLNPEHPLFVIAERIDWRQFDAAIDDCYAEELGRPGVSTRLMVGLIFLKHTFNESDESVVTRWVENPYWQFFCGCQYMQHDLPIDPSMMSKWRKRVGAERLEKLLEATIHAGLLMKALKPQDLVKVNVDTTVQEKAIAFPTDARLYHKMRRALVRRVKSLNIRLRQSYRFTGKNALFMQSRYAHARQMKRAAKMTRRLKTILGRVVRDIERKARKIRGKIADEPLRELLALAHRLLVQERSSKNKIYSVHGDANVHVVRIIPKKATRAVRRMLKRRAAVEPTIGHLKSDNRMIRNYLTGKAGDKINTLLAAAGYNLRKLLRWIVFSPVLCSCCVFEPRFGPKSITRARQLFRRSPEKGYPIYHGEADSGFIRDD